MTVIICVNVFFPRVSELKETLVLEKGSIGSKFLMSQVRSKFLELDADCDGAITAADLRPVVGFVFNQQEMEKIQDHIFGPEKQDRKLNYQGNLSLLFVI